MKTEIELAKLFKSVSPSEKYYDEMQQAATMLRQQQERIEKLIDWMRSIHLFLESTCGEEFTAEVFRKPPDTVGVIYEY